MNPLSYETLEERNARVFSHFSIFDLREISDEQIKRGEVLLKEKPVSIVAQGNKGFFEWFEIESGNNQYRVHKFMNFCTCSCGSFFFNHFCRHISATFPPTCECGREISERFGQCSKCEMASAIYYKPEKESQKIQGMRI